MDRVVGALRLATETPPSISARKLLSLTGINELNIVVFVLCYLTVTIYTKTTIHVSVGGQW